MRTRILSWLAVLLVSAATLGSTLGGAIVDVTEAETDPDVTLATLTAIDGNEYLSRGYKGEVPTVIHLALQAWVTSCLGERKSAFTFGGWATATQIIGTSRDVLGVQPLAVTEMNEETGFAIVIVLRPFWYFLPVLSHEMLHVRTGAYDGPEMAPFTLRCQIRSPLLFEMLPVLSPDSVAALQALARR